MSRWTRSGQFVAVAAIAGAAVSFAMRGSGAASAARTGSVGSAAPEAASVESSEPAQLNEIATAMAAAIKQNAAAAPRAAPETRPREHPSLAARQAEMTHIHEMHERHLEAHALETRDMAWAPVMEDRIKRTMAEREGGPSIDKVDCRGTSCLVDMSWASAGPTTLQDAMARSMGFMCTRELVLPEDAPDDGRYRATMYVDCSQSRQQSAQATR